MTAAASPHSYAKMAAAPQGGYLEEETEDSIADQDTAPPGSPGTAHPPLHPAPSPSSTESLLGRLNAGLASTPMLDPNTGMLLAESEACETTPAPH